jgi:cytidine deaminase
MFQRKRNMAVFKELEFDELADKYKELIGFAKEALTLSYSPYSKFKVGCAVLLSNGEILKGANIENASYPLCICAERVALATVISQRPGEKVIAMAITAKSLEKPVLKPISPCGACRQVICEMEVVMGQNFEIILQGESGKVEIWPDGRSLLPVAFESSFLL